MAKAPLQGVLMESWTFGSFNDDEMAAFLHAYAKHRMLADKEFRYPESCALALKELRTLEKEGGRVILFAQHNEIIAIGAFRLRQWDSDLFGFPVASLDHLYVKTGEFGAAPLLLDVLFDWTRKENVRFLFAKVPWQIENAKAMSEKGLYLVEAAYNLTKTFTARDEPLPFPDIRTARTDELPRLLAISAGAGWPGRFHSDPAIGPERAREAYARWIAGGLGRDEHTHITVLDIDGVPQGFVLWSVEEMILGGEKVRVADWELSAMARECQGKGLGTRLYHGALYEIWQSGARHVTQGVSVHNAPALNIVINKLGFRPNYQTFVYHKFF